MEYAVWTKAMKSSWWDYFWALLPTGETQSMNDDKVRKCASLADTALAEHKARWGNKPKGVAEP